MAWELKGELKFKDGRTSKFAVETDNNLKSTIEGVKKISSDISVVLTELVEEEKHRGVESRALDEDEDEEEADEEEADADTESPAVKLKSEPPAKRLKSITPS